MRHILLLFLTFFGLQAFAQSPTQLRVSINGKDVDVPRSRENRTYVYYTIDNSFVEHDTTFLFRQYAVKKCDGCDLQKAEMSFSYFISFAKEKNHREHVRSIVRKGNNMADSTLLSEAILEMDKEIIYNDLQDIPRRWYYPIEYDNRFFISADRPFMFELTDSLIINQTGDVWCSQLSDVKKLNKKSFSYKENGYLNIITPSKKMKGLYIMTIHTPQNTVIKELVCPEESLKYFDIIDICGSSPAKAPHFMHYSETDFDNL